MSKNNPLFDTLNSIFYKNSIEYNKKDCNRYILTLWLSGDKMLIPLVNRINENLFSIPDELVYKFFYRKVPKKKRFIKWTKKTNDFKSLEEKAKKIAEENGVSLREAYRSL